MHMHAMTTNIETGNVVIKDSAINVLCLSDKEYLSDDFLRYLDSYLEDFLALISTRRSGGYPRECLPGYVTFVMYEAIGNILFGLTVDDPEYLSMDTKQRVYDVLWS